MNPQPPSRSIPVPAVIHLLDDSPINLCGDDTPTGDNTSAGNDAPFVPIMVRNKDPTSDDPYTTDVRHRMFNLLKSRDVEGSTQTLSQAYIRVNLVNPLIERRDHLCNKAKEITRKTN